MQRLQNTGSAKQETENRVRISPVRLGNRTYRAWGIPIHNVSKGGYQMKKVLFPILLIFGVGLIILPLYLTLKRDVPDTLHFESPQWHLPEGVKARIGSGRVNVMRYSPDGNLLAVGSDIGVWIYDAHTAEPQSLFTTHTSVVNSVSFTPDGRMLAAGCADGTIWVWDLSTGEHKHTFTRHEYRYVRDGVDSVSFTPDGRTLASATGYHLDLWDIVTGTRKQSPTAHESRDPDSIDILPYITLNSWDGVFSPDRKTIANWSWDKDTIQLWDITTRKQTQTITVECKSNKMAMALSQDGTTLATVCTDEPIQLWDVPTGSEKQMISVDTATRWNIPKMVFSPDGTTLAVYNVDEHIRLWTVNGGKKRKILRGHKNLVGGIAFSPDSRTLVSSSYDNTFRLWDIRTGKHKKITTGHGNPFKNVSLSPDGETFMSLNYGGNVIYSEMSVSYGGSNAIHLWNIHTGKHKKTFQGHKKGIVEARLSPDGKHLMSWTLNNSTIRLWNISTGELKKLKGPKKHVSGVAFSSDGEALVSWGVGNKSKIIHLWDVETLHRKQTVEGDWMYMGARYLDRKTFAGLDWSSIYEPVRLHLLDIPTGAYTVKEIMPKKTVTREVSSASFSPDGRTIAIIFKDWPIDKSGRHLNIELWDVNTGQHKQTLKGHTDDILSIGFSPDSRILASGSRDKTIRLWDVNTGQHKQTFTAQDWIDDQFDEEGRVWKIAFSPDGKTLASGMWRGPIHLWDTVTGQQKTTLTGHTRWVQHLLFSEDGRTLISTSGDQTVLVWDLTEL